VNKQRKFYEEQARALILQIREAKDVSYTDLARRLEAYGSMQSRKTLTNKLHRGGYSFEFAPQVLAALGVTSLRILQLPRELQRPDPGTDSPSNDD
jgi:hypothetical protein